MGTPPAPTVALANGGTLGSGLSLLVFVTASSGSLQVAVETRASGSFYTAKGAALTTLAPEGLNGTNRMKLFVFGSDEHCQARLVAQLDNLGKGASGAAVQNLNLMLGLPEDAGL